MELNIYGIFCVFALLHQWQAFAHDNHAAFDEEDSAGCSRNVLPKLSEFGKLSTDKDFYEIGEKIQIICDVGFKADENSTSTCLDNQFIPNVLNCVEQDIGCPKSNLPEVVGKGKINEIKDVYDFGEIIEVKCEENYEIIGKTQSKCENNFKFNPNVLTCKRKAGCSREALPVIDGFGKLSPDKEFYQIGETIKVNCDDGFLSNGNNTSTCTNNNQFTPNFLMCAEEDIGCPKSNLPEVVGKGKINEIKDVYDFGEIIEVKCEENYEIVGKTESKCENNFKFNPKVLTCKLKVSFGCSSSELPTVEGDGLVIPFKLKYEEKEKVTLLCGSDHEPRGPEFATCNGTTFFPSKLSCVKKEIVCMEPPMIFGNGKIEPKLKSYENGQTVQVVCNDRDGSTVSIDEATCINGTFTPYMFNCKEEELTCSKDSLPVVKGRGKFTPIQEVYMDGEKIELICDEGLVHGEHNHATCMDGMFYPQVVECILKSVGCDSSALPKIKGPGEVFPFMETYKEKQMVKLSCEDGYKTGENDHSFCIDGRFEPEQLQCLKTDFLCNRDDLPNVEGPGKLIPFRNSYLESEKIKLICEEGFEPRGQDHATCNMDGFCPSNLECVETVDQNGCGRELLPEVIGSGKLGPLKDVYGDGDIVSLNCANGFHTYQPYSVCIGNEFVPEQLECYQDRVGCYRLPNITGRGWFKPKKAFYQDGEKVTLKCRNGYEPDKDIHSVCVDEKFYPENLACKPVELTGCSTDSLPDIKGPGHFEPMKLHYEEREKISLVCPSGYISTKLRTTAVCKSSTFRPQMFGCTKLRSTCKDFSKKCSNYVKRGLCWKSCYRKICRKSCQICY